MISFNNYVENRHHLQVSESVHEICRLIVENNADFDDVWKKAVLPVLAEGDFYTEQGFLQKMGSGVKNYLGKIFNNVGQQAQPVQGLQLPAWISRVKQMAVQSGKVDPIALQTAILNSLKQKNIPLANSKPNDVQDVLKSFQLPMPATAAAKPGQVSPQQQVKMAAAEKMYKAAMLDVQQRFQQALGQFYNSVRDDAHRTNNKYAYEVLHLFTNKLNQTAQNAFTNMKVRATSSNPYTQMFTGGSRDRYNQRLAAMQAPGGTQTSVGTPPVPGLVPNTAATPTTGTMASPSSQVAVGAAPFNYANMATASNFANPFTAPNPALERPALPLGGFATARPGKLKFNNLQGESRRYDYFFL